jgi:DivIVA domain-containing protein
VIGEATESAAGGAHHDEPTAGPLDTGDAMFPHVARWSRGYDPDQVDAFFARARIAYEGPLEQSLGAEDVRSVAFDLVRGGYTPEAVDAALDRLEGAFLTRERAAFVARHGMAQWRARITEIARSLQPRTARPPGRRFAPPAHGLGYSAQDVDAVIDRLVDYFDHDSDLTAAELRTVTFRKARGDRAYAEGPVDAYLDRAVKVLLAVE